MADDSSSTNNDEGSSGLMSIVDTIKPMVSKALDFQGNLQHSYNIANAAVHGDPDAQTQQAHDSLGMAMGTIRAPEGILADVPQAQLPNAGYVKNLAQTEALKDAAGLTLQQQAAAAQRYSAALDSANRLKFQKRGYAKGGEVNPMATEPVPDQIDQSAASPMTSIAQAAGQEVAPQGPQVPIFDISSAQPQLGSMDPSEVTDAVASGRYTLPKGSPIRVISPDGDHGSIDPSEAPQAFKAGYKYATPEDINAHEYGSTGQQAIAGLEGVAQGVLGPIATGAERALGVSSEGIEGRAKYNPFTHGVGEVAGLAGGLLTGTGVGGVVNAAEHLIPEGASILAKVGSAAAKGAIGNAIIQSGDEISKTLLNNPNQDIGSVAADVGLSALFGGVAGGALGSVAPIWNATVGREVGGVLKAVTDRLGGIEGQIPDDVDHAISSLGLNPSPEIRAAMSNDPAIRQYASILNQSDTTNAGRAYQEAVQDFHNQVLESTVKALGKDPATLTDEFSEARGGQKIGETLAKEYAEKMGPISEAYKGNTEKYGKAELVPSIADRVDDVSKTQSKLMVELNKTMKAARDSMKSGNATSAIENAAKIEDIQGTLAKLQQAAKMPGTVDMLGDKIARLVDGNGWTGSEDIMKEVKRLMKRIPELRTVGDLQKEMSTVGNNTASKLPFGMQDPVSRAGGMLKAVLRDAEADAVGRVIGSEEGADALEKFQSARREFAKVASLKDALDDRLKIRGSATNYAKGLGEMAKTDGESVFRRLSGKGDADILRVLQDSFPRTAEALRETHIDQLTSRAARAAKGKGIINPTTLAKSIADMSPELRNFAVKPEVQAKLGAASTLLENIKDPTHNFSNTGRTVDKLMQNVPSSALAVISALTGHGTIAAALLGGLGKVISKDAPDAMRLAMLKFLGSNKPIQPGAFKAMLDMYHSTLKGQNMAANAAKNIFKAGAAVIPEHAIPSDSARKKLDKQLQSLQVDQKPLLDVGSQVSHYMPEHGVAMSAAASSAANYLNSIRPKPTTNLMFDKTSKPAPGEQSNFNRQLDIAQQPLMVLKHINDGTLLPQDIQTLKTIYPDYYQHLGGQIMQQASDHMAKGTEIPYKKIIGMSLFLGQPMDSTLTPQGIMGAQPQPQSPQEPREEASTQKPPSESKMKGLSKLPSSYQTQSQSAEAERNKRK